MPIGHGSKRASRGSAYTSVGTPTARSLIFPGVNPMVVSEYCCGHSSIQVTYDVYGHLLPGSHQEAAALLETYLTQQQRAAEDKARAADVRRDWRA